MWTFSEERQDALAELINVGIGRAASALSEMTEEEVMLDVPRVELVSRDQAGESLGESLSSEISAVRQAFNGPFAGDSFLIFPQEQSLELVRRLLQQETPLEAMTELAQEALCEVGNVLLNATLSALADCLDVEIDTGLPSCHRIASRSFLQAESSDECILFGHINFSLKTTQVSGYVAFVMEVASLETLGTHLDRYFAEACGDPAA